MEIFDVKAIFSHWFRFSNEAEAVPKNCKPSTARAGHELVSSVVRDGAKIKSKEREKERVGD